MAFARKVISAGSALNAAGAIGPVDMQNITELAMMVVFGAGTSAGAVQLEEGPAIDFTGTWAVIGAPIAWAAANSTLVRRSTGVGLAARARISTAVVGGTVDVWLIGK